MCVYSMVSDHFIEKWTPRQPLKLEPFLPPPMEPFRIGPPYPNEPAYVPPPMILTPEEIADMKKLLERAKEYDKANGEPECELAEKKRRLIELAKELGATVTLP